MKEKKEWRNNWEIRRKNEWITDEKKDITMKSKERKEEEI